MKCFGKKRSDVHTSSDNIRRDTRSEMPTWEVKSAAPAPSTATTRQQQQGLLSKKSFGLHIRPHLAQLTKKDIKLLSKQPIGESTFKAVYQGALVRSVNGVGADGEEVAVIVLRRGAALPDKMDVYEKLARHPSLARLMGVIESGGNVNNLVMEWSHLGSLAHVLRGYMQQRTPIAPAVLTTAFIQVCDAMLQLSHIGMVHRALALRNVLAFAFDPHRPDKVTVKITDYFYSGVLQPRQAPPGSTANLKTTSPQQARATGTAGSQAVGAESMTEIAGEEGDDEEDEGDVFGAALDPSNSIWELEEGSQQYVMVAMKPDPDPGHPQPEPNLILHHTAAAARAGSPAVPGKAQASSREAAKREAKAEAEGGAGGAEGGRQVVSGMTRKGGGAERRVVHSEAVPGDVAPTGVGDGMPIRWLAPEVIADLSWSQKSDVWSYGVTVWEICNCGMKRPYGEVETEEAVGRGVREEGLRLDVPAFCPDYLKALLVRCFKRDPAARPTFSQAVVEEADLSSLVRPCTHCRLRSELQRANPSAAMPVFVLD